MVKKTRSPNSPDRGLEEVYNMVHDIYTEYGKAHLSEEEFAGVLGHTTTNSGPFRSKKSTLTAYGLICQDDDHYYVADEYLDLRDNSRDSDKFARTAYDLLKNVTVFDELLEDLHDRIPGDDAVANRFERNGFSRDRAEKVASVFRNSLDFAGLLRNGNRISRPGETEENDDDEEASSPDDIPPSPGDIPGSPGDQSRPNQQLRFELATSNGEKVVILYPQDLTVDDAQRVAAVLNAIAAPDSLE